MIENNTTTENTTPKHDAFERIEGLSQHVREYVQTRIEQTKLDIAEKTSLVIGNLIAVAVVMTLAVFVLIFGSIAGAWALGEWLNSTAAGFLIVAGIYLLIAIILWFARGPIIRFPVMNAIIRQLHKKEKDEPETQPEPDLQN
jgi:uncharacterized membrane protein YdbT with pleckstrin-like domain